ncbi:MAG: hypothetical protein K0Q72_4030 [Armatimonadetes bacterium]|jgi:hypothetical protein|nr:hypothetical protein [Armatimonadota bacterium]
MNSLRHNKLWLAISLVFALVFTTGASPASALACLLPEATVVAGPATAASCPAMAQPGPCCCHQEAAGEHAAAPAEHQAEQVLGLAGCSCSVQAPKPVPTESKGPVLVLSLGAALLPNSPASLQLPTGSTWDAAPSSGTPRTPYTPSGPSRAPPAC